MNNLVIFNDEIYMLVKPVKALLKSTMVYEVVTEGRKFAVKMSTGELTIIDLREPEKEKKPSINSEGSLYAKFYSIDNEGNIIHQSRPIIIREFQDVINYIQGLSNISFSKNLKNKIVFSYSNETETELNFEIKALSWNSYNTEVTKTALTNILVLGQLFNRSLDVIKKTSAKKKSDAGYYKNEAGYYSNNVR